MRLFTTTAILAMTASMASADYTLHIVHINDLHSRIESINKYDSTCNAEGEAEGKCFGGVARVKTMFDQLRAELDGENVIFVDAGDQYQGSLMYTTYKGDVEAEMMNLIGFDVMAVGNHEFDDGPEGLAKLIDTASFPIVSGNLDVSQSELLNGKLKNHVVLEVGGQKIGIVSALASDTVDTSSPGPDVIFQDEIDSLKADVATLEAEGIDKIIAVNHVGVFKDMQIAQEVAGLDAVIGGHSHTLMSNTVDGAMAYPSMEVAGTPVVQAYAYSKYVGHLTLTFDDAGNVTSATGDTKVLDASVTPDADILARVAELAGPIEELKARVVGSTAEAIDGDRANCRTGECGMGNLVASAMLDRVRGQGVQIAIQNGGGLRSSIDAGEVTMGEVLTVLPFQNTLATFELTGAGVIAALENGVSQVEEVKGRFPQVAGITFTWDPSVAAGEGRIQEVMVMSADGSMAPIDPAATYGVVSNNYMRSGGDGYKVFANEGANAYDFGPDLADVVAEFITANGTGAASLDGRIAVK